MIDTASQYFSSAVPTASTGRTKLIAGAAGRTLRRAAAPMLRGFALFLGTFALFNLGGALALPTFDATIWWIDLSLLPSPLRPAFLLVFGASLIAFAVRPSMGPARRIMSAVLAGAALAIALVNTWEYFSLRAAGSITGSAVPFSLLIALPLAGVLAAMLMRRSGGGRARAMVVCALGTAVAFPLLQMACFGTTDYRRPADVVVVLGAKAYADGTPSVPLGDRVRTACELYHAGLAPRLLFSGGPGDGRMHETESMRRFAVSLGVPPDAIVLDTRGLSTQATVDATTPMLRSMGARRVMVVSHAYHLPRVKMAYQRAGLDVFTVPARESYTLGAMPYYVAREVAGLWAYYFGPLLR